MRLGDSACAARVARAHLVFLAREPSLLLLGVRARVGVQLLEPARGRHVVGFPAVGVVGARARRALQLAPRARTSALSVVDARLERELGVAASVAARRRRLARGAIQILPHGFLRGRVVLRRREAVDHRAAVRGYDGRRTATAARARSG